MPPVHRVLCPVTRLPQTFCALTFATKTVLAQNMLARAFAAAVPASWVAADSLYGRGHRFRQWLEKQERAYIVGILQCGWVGEQPPGHLAS